MAVAARGVTRVDDLDSLRTSIHALIATNLFGDRVIVEQYLDGEELTVTVMPGAHGPSVLPPVRRFNHVDGIAPYNGAVAVTANSEVLDADACAAPPVRVLTQACAVIFADIEALAPIHVDCCADGTGRFQVFDINMKPNMTGAGRPGRNDQDSLSAIGAKGVGWDYADLLMAMLNYAWKALS